MNRTEFEALRDLPEKRIAQDIRFSRRAALRPALEVDGVEIENNCGIDLRMNLHFNPETGAKTVNVYSPGTGAICRLDVDGTYHVNSGRSHKHALQSERCPDRNLPDGVLSREDLAGKTMKEVFEEFCKIASIAFNGTFYPPEES
jgi:hypothetical protein